MSIHPSKLEGLMREHLSDESIVVRDMTDNGGFGLVRYERVLTVVGGPAPVSAIEHVVHRWATVYTDGTPVQTDSGLLLYSGAYFEDDGREPSAEQLARDEYRRRDDRPMATSNFTTADTKES